MEGRETGKLGAQKGNMEKVGGPFWVRIPLGNQTARTHARTNETKRFPNWAHTPTSD